MNTHCLHWNSIDEVNICNRPHHLMEAKLNFYPPTNQTRPNLLMQLQKLSASQNEKQTTYKRKKEHVSSK